MDWTQDNSIAKLQLQQLDSDGTKLDINVGAMDTIFVKHVKDGSPAQRAGLNTGDRIIAVNGESIAGKSYAQVIQLIQRSGNVLQLRVVPKEDDILQLYFPGTAYRSTPSDMSRFSSSSGGPPSSLPIQTSSVGGTTDPRQPSPSELGRRRYSELPSLFQPVNQSVGGCGSTWSVSNAGLIYGTSGDRSRSSSDLSPASSSSSSSLLTSRPLLTYQSYLRPWPPKSNYNLNIQPCPPATEYITSSSGSMAPSTTTTTTTTTTTNNEIGGILNASTSSSVTSSREASIERPDVNDSIINRLKASFEKKEEFLLRTGPCVVNQRLFNVSSSSSVNNTAGNDSNVSSPSSTSSSAVQVPTSVSGASNSAHFTYTAPVRTLMGIEIEDSAVPRPETKSEVVIPVETGTAQEVVKFTGETSITQMNGRQLRKASSLDSGNHLPNAAVPLKTYPAASSSTGSAGSIVVDPNGCPHGIHLVSQRAKLFETGTLEQESNNRMKLYKNELARMTTRGQTPRVSDRAAQFESLSTSQETIGSESDYSSSPRQKPSKNDVGHKMRNSGGKMTSVEMKPNSHANILRSNLVGANANARKTARSKQRHHHHHHHHRYHKRSLSSDGYIQKPELVCVSYSENMLLPETPVLYRLAHPATQFKGGASQSSVSGVPLRQRVIYEDGDNRATRRISYLKATSSDGGRVGGGHFIFGEEDEEEETEEECTTPPSSSSSSRLTTNSTETKTSGSKVQSIQKLKSFFGEKTPQIVHAATDRSRRFRDFPAVSSLLLPPTSSSLDKEGWLHCKVAVIDGKRANDRSWKQLWAILKGHTLHLYKDRKDAFQHQVSQIVEEHPIDLLRCRLEQASDYTKKKHVFRIVTSCGSEYLFQAESSSEMQKWIRDLQNSVDANEMAVISQGIVQKKSAIFEREILQQVNNTAPGSKGIRKLAPFRSRSPTGHSPTSKTRKSSHSADDTSPKSKTWRGKMVKTIRKIHGTSPAADVVGGVTIGVPLDECPCSAKNEYLPLMIELCTSIVEARGLEVVGIYRVPGNTAAVSYLMESVDRGFDQLNLQDPRWNDVNVISSLLKAFFRKLPEPLLTCELYPAFIEASKCDNPDRRMYEIKKMLHQLPDCNYESLKYLIRHLQKVVEHSNINKMEARNLAIVFGPTLVRAADDNMVTMVTDMSFQCRIVETLINYGDWFFSSDENEDISNCYFGGREAILVDEVPLPNANLLLLNNVMKVESAQAELRPKEVSAKDLVSSIIGAANRKVKQKMRRHAATHDSSHSTKSSSIEERDIDREIELRLHQNGAAKVLSSSETNGEALVTENNKHRHDRRHSEDSTISSMSIRAPSDEFSCPRKMSVDSLDGLSAIPRTSCEKERAFCVVRASPSSKRTLWECGTVINDDNLTELSTTRTEPLTSDDLPSFSVPNETSDQSVLKTYAGLSASMQERIRKFELETKALLQRDSSATRSDQQLDRQRIEDEWQRAKFDLEHDEDFLDRLADNSLVINNYNSSLDVNSKLESPLPSSPPKIQRQTSSANQSSRRNDRSAPAPAPWPINPFRRTTAANLTAKRSDMKRVNSVESFTREKQTGRTSAKGWASQRRKAISAEVPPGGEDWLLGQGPAKWCGSLDSLREFYDISNSSSLQNSVEGERVSKLKETRRSDNKIGEREKNSTSKSEKMAVKASSTEAIVCTSTNTNEKSNEIKTKTKDDDGGNEIDDISFQRNENTLITATLSTIANTIMTTTSATAVMTATIKSTKPILGHRGSDPTSLNGSVMAFRDKKYDYGTVNQKRLSSNSGGSKKGRASPPLSSTSQRKSSHLRSLKRRHTVGGTKDFEKFRLLVSASASGGGGYGNGSGYGGSANVNQKDLDNNAEAGLISNSAWERLRPAVPPEQRSMKSWLKMERLRTSSPELQQHLPLTVNVATESFMDVDEKKSLRETQQLSLRETPQQSSTTLEIQPALESQV
ncbi:hypothetical protein CHUAL_002760 [Chamberlinius hualienensis]